MSDNEGLAIDARDAVALLQGRFQLVCETLRDVPTRGSAHPLAAAATIIRRYSRLSWRLNWTTGSALFRVRLAQSEISLSSSDFGTFIVKLLAWINVQNDRFVRDVIEHYEPSAVAEAIVDLFLALFLAHEWFHVDQRLGSDQYEDSDSYLDVVAAIDYQADLAALDYVLRAETLFRNLPAHQRLPLLILIHIAAMRAFLPAEGPSAPDMDRLLIWNFQAARIVSANTAVDPRHPSIASMPRFVFPKLRAAEARSNSEALTAARQDIVLAVADFRGIQSIIRLSSTAENRARELETSIRNGDFAGTRDCLEELFLTDERLRDFRGRNPIVLALETLRHAGELLLQHWQDGRILALGDVDVTQFFEQAEHLIVNATPALRGEGIQEYRERYRDGALQKINQELEASGGKAPELLADEIRRVTLRISSSLDEIIVAE